MQENEGSWKEWSKHVLLELQRLNENQQSTNQKLNKVLEDHGNRITKLESQAGFVKAGLAFVGTLVIWALNKFYNH